MLYRIQAPQTTPLHSTFRERWEASQNKWAVAARGAPPSLPVINGRSLVHTKFTAAQKAAVAARILNGEVILQPSASQLAKMFDVSLPYINAATKLVPAKRAAIANGTDKTSFTSLMSSSKKQAALPRPRSLALPRPVTDIVTDGQLADIIKSVGVDRALAVACQVENATA